MELFLSRAGGKMTFVVYLTTLKQKSMKKHFVFYCLILLASLHSYPLQAKSNISAVKEALTVNVSVSCDGKGVSGAMVKLVTKVGGITIGAAATDASGKALISVPTYGKQLVSIQVTHAMYRDGSLSDLVLENGLTYAVPVKSRTQSAEVVASNSAEKVAKAEDKTAKSEEKASNYEREAEQHAADKEKAAASQEQLKKEREEAERAAAEKK